MYNRYSDATKFVTDPSKLQIVNGSEVYISSDIVVDLQGHTEEFERLKPFITLVAQSICDLDNTTQKFDNLHSKSSQFPYVVAIVFIDEPNVILEYWGTEENTQFDVVFEHNDGMFTLKSFGTILNIPPDWEQTLSADHNEKTSSPKGFLRRLIDWL